MSRRKTDWTQAKFDRYNKEGRGQGEGSNYTPWVKVSDFSSKGRVLRGLGWKTNREHHLLSASKSVVNEITTVLDKEMNVEAGTSLYLFQHLIARKEIVVNMLSEKPLSYLPAREIKFA